MTDLIEVSMQKVNIPRYKKTVEKLLKNDKNECYNN